LTFTIALLDITATTKRFPLHSLFVLGIPSSVNHDLNIYLSDSCKKRAPNPPNETLGLYIEWCMFHFRNNNWKTTTILLSWRK